MTSRGSQSHGGQVRRKAHVCAGCADLAVSGPSARYARRALLRAAVFDNPVFDGREQEFWAHRPPSAATVVTGVLTEVTPRAIVVSRSDGEQFLALSPSTVTWLGAKASPSALRAGDPVIVRRRTHRLASGAPAPGGPGRQHRRAHLGQDRPGRGRDHGGARTGAAGRYRAARPRARAGRDRRSVAPPRPGPLSPADARLPDRRDRHPPRRRLPAGGHACHRAAALPRRPSARSPARQRVQRRSDQRRGGLARAGRRARRSARGRLRRPRPGDRGRAGTARPTPPTSTSPARGCRTCRSAAPCGSGTSAPTGRRCCRSPAAAPARGSSATGA